MNETIALVIAAISAAVAFVYAAMLLIKNKTFNSAQKYRDTVFQQTHLQDDTDILKTVEEHIESGKGVSKEMAIIKAMIAKDPVYAWSWYCNLVMSFVSEGCDKVTAMKGAARFLNVLAHIDVTKDARYIEEIERLQDPQQAAQFFTADVTRPGPLV